MDGGNHPLVNFFDLILTSISCVIALALKKRKGRLASIPITRRIEYWELPFIELKKSLLSHNYKGG